MGSACCVAARERTVPDQISSEIMQRNIRYSPSWGCRWDNRRGRVSGEVWNSPDHYSHENSGNFSLETKGRMSIGYDNISDSGSRSGNYRTPTPTKSPSPGVSSGWTATGLDLSCESKCTSGMNSLVDSLSVAGPSASVGSLSVPSTPSSLLKSDSVASQSQPHSADMVRPGLAGRSPNQQFFRQVSDSRILGFKSPSNSTPERRQSFALSQCSTSDGWSREQWSFDTETLETSRAKNTGSNRSSIESPMIDIQTCGACSKLLTEKCIWSSGKMIANSELAVVAVLLCGHAYHADCLENMTAETDKYDPPCLVCTYGEKRVLKMLGKALSVKNKVSRYCQGDTNFDGESVVFREREGKSLKIGTGLSSKSSFAPFLRRHFSHGSKSTKLMLEDEFVKPPRKKGLWRSYSKA